MYKPKTQTGLKKIIYNRTSVNEQILTSTYTALTGTTVAYTPASNADHVIYEYRIMAHNDPDTTYTSGFLELQEEISGTWTSLFENGNSGYQVWEQHTYTRYQNIWEGRFVIPAYSGSKSFRLGCYSTDSQESTVHSTEDSQVVHPEISIYSVIN